MEIGDKVILNPALLDEHRELDWHGSTPPDNVVTAWRNRDTVKIFGEGLRRDQFYCTTNYGITFFIDASLLKKCKNEYLNFEPIWN